jgi:hypothetical protein
VYDNFDGFQQFIENAFSNIRPMAPGSTDTELVQDAPINEVGDTQPTTSHISSDTKSEKTPEIFNHTPALVLHETPPPRRNPDRQTRARQPTQLQSTLSNSDVWSHCKSVVPKAISSNRPHPTKKIT